MLTRRRDELLRVAKQAAGAWLGMEQDDFGLVSNATEGINAVLRSLMPGPGDELLTTTHVYHAVRQAMKYVATQSGAAYREIEIPLPIESPEVIVEQIVKGLSAKTRLLVVDHVTSPTAIVFPVARLVAECSSRGVDVLIDGAHAGNVAVERHRVGSRLLRRKSAQMGVRPRGASLCGSVPTDNPAFIP